MILDGTSCVLHIFTCFANPTFSFIGAMSAFVFGENLGRKRTFMIGVIVMSIGAILQTAAFSVAQMIVARLITGKQVFFFRSC